MTRAPAVLVQDRASIERALAPGLPVTLLSPPGFALYAGVPWWRALLVGAAFTGVALLDCGDAAGRALEALRIGLGGVILSAKAVIFEQISAIGRETGAIVLRAAPDAFDATGNNDDAALQCWLAGSGLTGIQNLAIPGAHH